VLHDDVYRKVNHVSRGLLKSLLSEISHTLVVNNLEEVAPLRLELYGATMQKDCACDLQMWVNFIVERAGKLSFLKRPVEEAELVSLFLKGLHPVFNQLQVYFAIPGSLPKTFEGAVAITRKFASNPTVAADLAKLRSSGLSQSMFPVTAQSQVGVPQNMFPVTAQGVQAPSQSKSKQLCRLFASSGTCKYGARCRFVHTPSPTATQQTQIPTGRKCNFCSKFGHSEDICNTKQRLLDQLRQQQQNSAALSAVSSSSGDNKFEVDTSTSTNNTTDNAFFNFMFTTSTSVVNTQHWVLDSGATCCATAKLIVWTFATAK
jgi:hypothetical protein